MAFQHYPSHGTLSPYVATCKQCRSSFELRVKHLSRKRSSNIGKHGSQSFYCSFDDVYLPRYKYHGTLLSRRCVFPTV